MKRWSLLGLALAGVLALGLASPISADTSVPSQGQLQGALLGASDLASGFA